MEVWNIKVCEGNKNQLKIMLMAFCIIQKDPFWVRSRLLCYHLEAAVDYQWAGFVSFLLNFSPLSQVHPSRIAVQLSPLLHLYFPCPLMSCAGKEWGSERKSEGSRNIHPREEPSLSRKTFELLELCQTPLMVTSARLSLCGWLVGLWFGCSQMITGCKRCLFKKSLFISAWSW